MYDEEGVSLTPAQLLAAGYRLPPLPHPAQPVPPGTTCAVGCEGERIEAGYPVSQMVTPAAPCWNDWLSWKS